MKDLTRAQGEAWVQNTVNQEMIVLNERTCRAAGLVAERPQPTNREKVSESASPAQCHDMKKLVNNQTRSVERHDTFVSKGSLMAETPPQLPSIGRARQSRTSKNKKRSSKHRKKERKRSSKYTG